MYFLNYRAIALAPLGLTNLWSPYCCHFLTFTGDRGARVVDRF